MIMVSILSNMQLVIFWERHFTKHTPQEDCNVFVRMPQSCFALTLLSWFLCSPNFQVAFITFATTAVIHLNLTRTADTYVSQMSAYLTYNFLLVTIETDVILSIRVYFGIHMVQNFIVSSCLRVRALFVLAMHTLKVALYLYHKGIMLP